MMLIFSISGKLKISSVLSKNDLRHAVSTFYEENVTADEVAAAGEDIIRSFYSAPQSQTDLDAYRYECFLKCVTGNRSQLSGLPPSKAAAREHSLRVYLQVQTWLGRTLDPSEWGWERTGDGL